MMEEIREICRALLEKWCPPGMYVADGYMLKWKPDVLRAAKELWIVSLRPDQDVPLPLVMFAFGGNTNQHFQHTRLFGHTIQHLRMLVDLSNPDDTALVKEAITNIRQTEVAK